MLKSRVFISASWHSALPSRSTLPSFRDRVYTVLIATLWSPLWLGWALGDPGSCLSRVEFIKELFCLVLTTLVPDKFKLTEGFIFRVPCNSFVVIKHIFYVSKLFYTIRIFQISPLIRVHRPAEQILDSLNAQSKNQACICLTATFGLYCWRPESLIACSPTFTVS